MILEKLPRFPLCELPTPVHHLKSFSALVGGPSIYMKRDELTSLAMGGNKTRKLEFLVGEALAQGKDTLVTAGGIQSNHCRLTAAAAARAGLSCHLVLNGDPPETPNGNLLLDRILGAQLHYCHRKDRDTTLYRVAKALEQKGSKPYVIPVGGSNSVGAVGYVKAMLELSAQLREMNIRPDAIVFPTSSGGTQAGLTLGAKLAGFDGRLLGMSIDQTKTGDDPFAPVLTDIANAAAKRLESDLIFTEEDFGLNCDYLGAGYAVPGDLEFNAIRDLARSEGILLGPVYTARAMGGLMDLIRKGVFKRNHTVVFWHTGGSPELFAWADQIKL
ncbi:MAG TPA: D-cysteine desulfhydrase family protein [Desulfobacteraceae bacterium]|nr:D-cysteine desulfhydrase family protein [Desulfobacteraceae bacterium]|tara:strand:+ start:524 stop:1513 length:990 start_codon:yes stop_codon:yes gene_type:complete